jgi:sentrin-specific protease 8
VLLRPSMCFMLMQTPDPRTIRVRFVTSTQCVSANLFVRSSQEALPDFSKTTHIFLPLTDSDEPERAEGGTHWSLLLVSVVDGVSFHYDSLPPGNTRKAQFCTQQVSVLLKKPLRFINLSDATLVDEEVVDGPGRRESEYESGG